MSVHPHQGAKGDAGGHGDGLEKGLKVKHRCKSQSWFWETSCLFSQEKAKEVILKVVNAGAPMGEDHVWQSIIQGNKRIA